MNEALGILKEWSYERNEKTKESRVFRLWVEFEDKLIGKMLGVVLSHGKP